MNSEAEGDDMWWGMTNRSCVPAPDPGDCIYPTNKMLPEVGATSVIIQMWALWGKRDINDYFRKQAYIAVLE